jgi:hypothetical protein
LTKSSESKQVDETALHEGRHCVYGSDPMLECANRRMSV